MKWVAEVLKILRGREQALRTLGFWGEADHLKRMIDAAPVAGEVEPLIARLLEIRRHYVLNKEDGHQITMACLVLRTLAPPPTIPARVPLVEREAMYPRTTL